MKFDITNIDKKKLLKTLFSHSFPTNHGVGKVEYLVRKDRGENVDSLTDEECEDILFNFNTYSDILPQSFRILDYYKGKPIKIVFDKQKNGRILVDSCGYDSRNGKYMFLVAMLNEFPKEEIFIVRKKYLPYTLSEIKDMDYLSKEEEAYFKNIIASSTKKQNSFGSYWQL